jgi:hypothetical protein
MLARIPITGSWSKESLVFTAVDSRMANLMLYDLSSLKGVVGIA